VSRLPHFLALVGTSVIGCAIAWPARSEDMCTVLTDFAGSISDSRPHTVTLITDWTLPEPTTACRRGEHQPEIQLCEWLVTHTSIEFMTVNIGTALECVGFQRHAKDENSYARIESLSGKVVAPHFASYGVILELNFDSSPKKGRPWLKITATRDVE
jgi:hypothetical protein